MQCVCMCVCVNGPSVVAVAGGAQRRACWYIPCLMNHKSQRVPDVASHYNYRSSPIFLDLIKLLSAWYDTHSGFTLTLPVADFLLSVCTDAELFQEDHDICKAPSTPATMSNAIQVERFFRQSRMLLRQQMLRHCCRFRQQCCRYWQQCRTKFYRFDKIKTN